MTEAEVEAEREQQRKARTCVCGNQKASAFSAVCDRCWFALPWELRQPLVKLSLHTEAGKAAKQAAERFLQKRKCEPAKR